MNYKEFTKKQVMTQYSRVVKEIGSVITRSGMYEVYLRCESPSEGVPFELRSK